MNSRFHTPYVNLFCPVCLQHKRLNRIIIIFKEYCYSEWVVILKYCIEAFVIRVHTFEIPFYFSLDFYTSYIFRRANPIDAVFSIFVG